MLRSALEPYRYFELKINCKLNSLGKAKEGESLDQSAGSIQGRVQRVHDVVMADMDNYEPDWYTDKVREESDKLLKGRVSNTFICFRTPSFNTV